MTVLDDTLRIAGPADIGAVETRVRAGGMALAQDWLLCLPAGDAKDRVLQRLESIVEDAVQAITG